MATDWKAAVDALTDRERELLVCVANGMSTKEITEAWSRSPKTIEWHGVMLHRKLGVKNRAQLTRIAVAAGVVTVEWEKAGAGV